MIANIKASDYTLFLNANKIEISNNLLVNGDASFNANVDISNNLIVNGDASFNSNVEISGSLILKGGSGVNIDIIDISSRSLTSMILVDQIYEKNVAIIFDNTEWKDVINGIGLLSSGTYIIQVFVNQVNGNTGPWSWNYYYSGMFSWYDNTISGKVDEEIDDLSEHIVLHAYGHDRARNGSDHPNHPFELRTSDAVINDKPPALQIKITTTPPSSPIEWNARFRFRRMM